MIDDKRNATPAATGPLWSDIPGYDGLYQISRDGEVRSTERAVKIGNHTRKVGGYNLAQPLDVQGRPIVRLSKNGATKTWRVHVLVALVYLGEKPPDTHVHHRNKDIEDNRDVNLIYINGVDHQRLHKKGKPGSVRGEKHGQAKLTPEKVREIRQRHLTGESYKGLARELGVDAETVTRAIKGITWGHIA